MKLSFFVPGVPKGAGSKHGFAVKKQGKYTGKVAMVDTSGSAGKDWRASIVQVAFEAMKKADLAPFTGPLVLHACFYLPRPKSHFDRYGKVRPTAPLLHSIRPDATKLVRALEDSITKIVWADDAQVCEQYVCKRYDLDPGCSVTVEKI